jgi:hypothetical protein
MFASLALLAIKLAPTLFSLVSQAVELLHDRQQLDAGDARAVARALTAAAKARGLAAAVETEAAKAHAADATDDAFDRAFERKD